MCCEVEGEDGVVVGCGVKRGAQDDEGLPGVDVWRGRYAAELKAPSNACSAERRPLAELDDVGLGWSSDICLADKTGERVPCLGS